ncbi:MAG TPA: RDD family protein [Thermosynechococcus sp. M98_K2018_005]|nr:RDD family protein [Thermosynechococcus sp. M98_K2018_005]HIK47217.1 RDD family protein [Thermosynechococcus sp. M55_K2018_012]
MFAMALSRQYPPPLPLAQPWRRAIATSIDFILIWLTSVVGITPGATLQWGQLFVFAIVWWLLRVAMVNRNKGQSPGHWLMNVRLLDQRQRTPDLLSLSKRELVIGVGALLTLAGLESHGLSMALMILALPLAVDCSLAWIDEEHRTLHDRLGGTKVYRCRRGFALDRKLIELVSKIRKDLP